MTLCEPFRFHTNETSKIQSLMENCKKKNTSVNKHCYWLTVKQIVGGAWPKWLQKVVSVTCKKVNQTFCLHYLTRIPLLVR